mgnify:CR=1 FL=1
MHLIKADVQFNVNGQPVSFSIIHNMPSAFGVSFDCALDNWLARTNEFTEKSLCEYIKSKQPEVIAVSYTEYADRLR